LQAAKKINKVIVGLGLTGYSCVRFFSQNNIPCAVTDSRQTPPMLKQCQENFPNVPLHLKGFDVDLLLQAEEIIVSQGVSVTEPALVKAKEAGIPLVSDIEIFARVTTEPIIAITGSNGKSTVTTLLAKMALAAGVKAKAGGNLGPPALDLLLDGDAELYILEISNFQLETTYSLKAKVACILNISPDHLDRYASFADYVATKQRVYQQCEIAVFNRDDDRTIPPSEVSLIKSFGGNSPLAQEFGLRESNDALHLAKGDECLMPVEKMALAGRLQWMNALAALAIADVLQWPLKPLLNVLKVFTGLPHRCEHIRFRHGVSWFNDSKGTNTGATLAALCAIGEVIPGKLVWIAGGEGKDADFSVLRQAVHEHVSQVILFGRDAKLIADAINPNFDTIVFVKDLSQAIDQAAQKACDGDAVLLSPACASFDMFNNFQERGEVFCRLVMELTE